MTYTLKRNKYLQNFSLTLSNDVKYQVPLILRMYGALNIIRLKNENRYILCNFLDQYSDVLEIDEDIYLTNNEKGLNQLLLFTLNKAKKHNLINALYHEYLNSFLAIRKKKEFNERSF